MRPDCTATKRERLSALVHRCVKEAGHTDYHLSNKGKRWSNTSVAMAVANSSCPTCDAPAGALNGYNPRIYADGTPPRYDCARCGYANETLLQQEHRLELRAREDERMRHNFEAIAEMNRKAREKSMQMKRGRGKSDAAKEVFG